MQASETTAENLEELDIRIELLARPRRDDPGTYLITVCLINRETLHGRLDPQCLFQSHFRVVLDDP